jgi:hypothetical protein
MTTTTTPRKTDNWQAFRNAVLNLHVSWPAEHFLTEWRSTSFSRTSSTEPFDWLVAWLVSEIPLRTCTLLSFFNFQTFTVVTVVFWAVTQCTGRNEVQSIKTRQHVSPKCLYPPTRPRVSQRGRQSTNCDCHLQCSFHVSRSSNW